MPKNRVQRFIKNPKKALFTLAWPILIGMFVHAMYNIVDTAFVGRLGAESIAALTFAFPIFFIFIALNAGLGAGIGSRISRFLGEKKKKSAENTAVHGLAIAIITSLILFIIGTLFIDPIFSVLGAAENVLVLTKEYMSIIFIGMFFMFPQFALSSILTAQGDTKTPMKIQVMTLVLNMVLDPIFIYTLGHGVKGAAIATTISYACALIFFIFYIRKAYVRPRLSTFRFSRRITREIIAVGAPASLMVFIMAVYFMFFNKFMASFGTKYIASFGMVLRLESVAVMPIVAFSLSLLTLVGMFYGAKKYDLIKEVMWYGIKTAVIITSSIGLLFFVFSNLFLRIFTADATLLSIGSAYIRIDVFTFPLIAVSMLISRAIQGMGRGVPGLVINIIRSFATAIPLAYIFVFVLGYGYLSMAVAMIIGGFTSAIVAVVWIEVLLKKYMSKNS